MNGPLPCTLLRFEIDGRASVARRPAKAEPAHRGGCAERRPRARDARAERTGQRPRSHAGAARWVAPSLRRPSSAALLSRPPSSSPTGCARTPAAGAATCAAPAITCYRVYDADLPDFALAVDVYERWVHVQEYAPPPEIDEAKAAARLAEAMRIVPEVLGAAPDDVFLKVRARQRGAAQYRAMPRAASSTRSTSVSCRFSSTSPTTSTPDCSCPAARSAACWAASPPGSGSSTSSATPEPPAWRPARAAPRARRPSI